MPFVRKSEKVSCFSKFPFKIFGGNLFFAYLCIRFRLETGRTATKIAIFD